MSSTEFLTQAVAGAQLLLDGYQMNWWKGVVIDSNFADQLAHGNKPVAAAPQAAQATSQAADTLQSAVGMQMSFLVQENKQIAAPEVTFGAILAEVFLEYSVLSKQDGPARLPPISTLNRHPVLGAGKSFIARKVPATSYSHHSAQFRGKDFVVFKSLRHRDRIGVQDERVLRLQNFLRELRVLTHSPLRKHENLISLIAVGWERNRLSRFDPMFFWPFLVLEHAEYGTLIDLLEHHPIDFETRLRLCMDVGMGIQAIHACDMIHGDIKPENILVCGHPARNYIAKIADFGFSIFNLEESSNSIRQIGWTDPWQAPESGQTLNFADGKLTDVYSYGFLLWRTTSYGHYPFHERSGMVAAECMEDIETAKTTDKVPDYAAAALMDVLNESLLTIVISVLRKSARFSAYPRNLNQCLALLSPTALALTSPMMEPIRATDIPLEQGLGIYTYGGRNVRLDKLYVQALESHYMYAKQLDESISLVSRLLVHHGSSTLFDHYLDSHFAGDIQRAPYKTPAKNCAFTALQLSASAHSAAAAESILPISKAFNCESAFIDSVHTTSVAGYALYRGSEFILRDLMLSDVPGKAKFLEAFTTKCCRGAGFRLSIAKEVFDGTGARYGDFLTKPYYMSVDEDSEKPSGIIDASYMLRIAAGWGALEDVQLLIHKHGADVNGRDSTAGETALLKACRAGHLDVVEWLITKGGALANIGSHKNVTPLHWLDSFLKSQVRKVAKLLHEAKGDPNAVMTEEFGGSEGEFWFFKGPPLMRVVASGNLEAVEALLEIGADPFVPRLVENKETPFIFAVRRARLDIIKSLVHHSLGAGTLWARTKNGSRPIQHVLASSPTYLAKIHRQHFEDALLETFDYFWLQEDPEKRLFKSIDSHGRIAISVAVANGNFPLVKRIVQSCPTSGHLKELVATLGMQTAIVWGRYAIFKYLLENGGLALHPVLNTEPEEDSQFETYVTCGPWTADLVGHQLKTNSLHLCAQAGEFAAQMCEDLLRSTLPVSRWEHTPEHLRKQDIINCTCNGPLEIDPIVDSRNELGETPFFLALQAEEYALAHTLYQAGASQNVTIPHRTISMQGMRSLPRDMDGLPLAEHLLTWTSAYRALHFIIHECWGCLRLTSSHGDELRTCVIHETAKWPVDEATELFEYVQERSYPGYGWNHAILYAIKMRNKAAVSALLRKREELIPDHREPGRLYDAVRLSLLELAQAKLDQDRSDAVETLTAILYSIKKHYPEHPLGSHSNDLFVKCAVLVLLAEVQLRVTRFNRSLIGLEKLEEELNRLIFPWLVCSLQGRGQVQKQIPMEFEGGVKDMLQSTALILFDPETCRVRLSRGLPVCRTSEEQDHEVKKLVAGFADADMVGRWDKPTQASTLVQSQASVSTYSSRSEPKRRNMRSIRTLLKRWK